MAKIKKETVESIKRSPIYTTDMKKVKSYQDSLSAFNTGQKMWDDFLNFANKNDITFVGDDRAAKPVDKINKNLIPIGSGYFYYGKENNGRASDSREVNKEVSQETENKLQSFLNSQLAKYVPSYKKPIQPYLFGIDKQLINPITPIGQKEINIEEENISPVELKNKKVSVEEPEHFLDISEPDGKGTKRMYFESREELENFQKENPMLKTGSFSRAMIDPRILEILKKKK
jgi:hypothetical protein